jgi:hypothetical protein
MNQWHERRMKENIEGESERYGESVSERRNVKWRNEIEMKSVMKINGNNISINKKRNSINEGVMKESDGRNEMWRRRNEESVSKSEENDNGMANNISVSRIIEESNRNGGG